MTDDILTFVANNVTYTLDLTVDGAATGNVTDITGTAGTQQITFVANDTYAAADQTITTTAPYMDMGGISWQVDGADQNIGYVVNYTSGSLSNYTGYVLETGSTSAPVFTAISTNTVAAQFNVCYVEGTRILTERGEIAVERLRVGDLAVTASGALRPIRWLGHRRIEARKHPRPELAQPIRISAHAFGRDRPSRDLYVSPGHALCVDVLDEVLIRAESLVNGTTIQQVDVESVDYWHVELASHDLLLAENLPAESYLDMANRSFFVESGVVSLVDIPDAPASAEHRFCRPLHEGGVIVEAVRMQLQLRALALGWSLQREPFNDLHLMVDGVRVDPTRDGLRATFDVPAGARDIRLVSRTSKPRHLPGDNTDTRDLGVCLKRVSVGETEIALDDPRLRQGFHRLETESWGAFRWTSGDCVLPASLFDDTPQGRRFSLDMLLPPLPFWVAPDAASSEAQAA